MPEDAGNYPLASVFIGGIEYSLWSRVPIDVEIPEGYREFLDKTSLPETDLTVRVCLEPNRIPDTPGLQTIFESGQAWSMLRGAEGRCILFHPPALAEHLWAAKFAGGLDEVRVDCSTQLIQQGGKRPRLASPLCYPLDLLLTMYVLSRNNGVIIHAAGVDFRGKGLIFPGKSGAGKSTLSRLLVAGQGVTVLSDDRIVVRKMDSGMRMFGTPWHGEAGICANRSCPLTGLYFLRHGAVNRVRKLSEKDGLERLLQASSIPWYDGDVARELMTVCGDLASKIPSYELEFRPDAAAIDVIQREIESRG